VSSTENGSAVPAMGNAIPPPFSCRHFSAIPPKLTPKTHDKTHPHFPPPSQP
jgi:hypothetical protein